MPVTLYYQHLMIGTLSSPRADFPGVYAQFDNLLPAHGCQLTEKINRFRQFCLTAESIGEQDQYGDNWSQFVSQHEDEHLELINSDDWSIITEDAQATHINVPVFHTDNSVSIRYL